MHLPRFRVRTLLVLVAAVGLGIAGGNEIAHLRRFRWEYEAKPFSTPCATRHHERTAFGPMTSGWLDVVRSTGRMRNSRPNGAAVGGCSPCRGRRRKSSCDALSWAGLASGNHESAGKRRSGRTTPGNTWLKTTLVQAVWAAFRAKGTELSKTFRRIAARRGKKRAAVAIAHTMLVIIYHLLKRDTDYKEIPHDSEAA